MLPQIETLSPNETAVISGVSLRDVHRVIDEHILPDSFYGPMQPRSFKSQACVFISFYFQAANRLTPEERQRTIALASQPSFDWNATKNLVRDEFLTIDFAPFRHAVDERLSRLQAARTMVISDPEIMGGTPVISGTRVPVYDVAASVAAGMTIDRILAAYPSLKLDQVELATLYALANPQRGRPRQRSAMPVGATVVESSTKARLKSA
jgi:uncharacterized protein (DUF433 family)